MAREWSTFKDKEKAEEAEERGTSKTWTLIGALSFAGLSALWALIETFGERALEFFKGH